MQENLCRFGPDLDGFMQILSRFNAVYADFMRFMQIYTDFMRFMQILYSLYADFKQFYADFMLILCRFMQIL